MFKFIVTVPVNVAKIGNPVLAEPVSETGRYLLKQVKGMIKELVKTRLGGPIKGEANVTVAVRYRETKKGNSWELKIIK